MFCKDVFSTEPGPIQQEFMKNYCIQKIGYSLVSTAFFGDFVYAWPANLDLYNWFPGERTG